MQDFLGKKILLGVCGGVAAYKSAQLVRELTRLGATVQVVMTRSAQKFISPLLMQALSGRAVRTELFDLDAERAMGHIELARWADYLVIAPASANCISKLAHGLADDLLSTLYLVIKTPVLICPAMNQSMWSHEATQANCKLLKTRQAIFVGPEDGSQACGEYGLGRLSETEQIISTLRVHEAYGLLRNKRVLITAGPTRENLDPVRYLSNHSSGRMGYALAEAAFMAGAQVTLISGPSTLLHSSAIKRIDIESAQDMLQAVTKELKHGDIFIGCAAVADYRAAHSANQKIKKTAAETVTIDLAKTPDILSAVSGLKKAAFVLGFAAETESLIEHASLKLIQKEMDMIAANQVGVERGFHVETNQITLITKNEHIELPLMHKSRLAARMIAIIASNLQNVPFVTEESI